MVTTHLFRGLLLPRIIARWLLFYNTTQLDAYKLDVPFISLILFLKQLRLQLANKAETPKLVINSRNPTQVTHFNKLLAMYSQNYYEIIIITQIVNAYFLYLRINLCYHTF